MPEEQSTPNPSGTVESASSGTTPTTVNPSGTVAPPATALTPEQQEIALHQSRAENAEMRKKLVAFEKAQADAEAAKLSDIEKAAKRAEAAEAQAKQFQEQLASAQVKLAAQSLGFANPDHAARLVSVKPEATAEDITAALTALLKSDPYLASGTQAPPSSGGNPTNPSRSQVGMPTFTADQLSDVDFYIANEAAIKLAMRDGRIKQ